MYVNMKIAGCIFRKSEIREYTRTTFLAHYKKREFYITSNQGYGKAKEPGKTRFYLSVMGDDGIYDVDYYDDFNNIKEAIEAALKGACLNKEE